MRLSFLGEPHFFYAEEPISAKKCLFCPFGLIKDAKKAPKNIRGSSVGVY